jgi:hypothetical protein
MTPKVRTPAFNNSLLWDEFIDLEPFGPIGCAYEGRS